jgi:hypothetical protein
MSSNPGTGEAVVCVDQEISGTISRGLHQTTQPLTVLQGTLELALLNASTVDEFRHAIERSLEELQRVTDSFEHLRTLTQLHQPASDVATFTPSSVAKAVLTSLQGHSAAAGVELVLQTKPGDRKPSGEDRVKMSRSRVSTALKMALLDLLAVLSRGSKVVLLIEAEARDVLIRAEVATGPQHGTKVSDAPPSLMTPRQELARAMMASAGGELIFSPSPCGLLIRLPKVFSTTERVEVEQPKGEVAHV